MDVTGMPVLQVSDGVSIVDASVTPACLARLAATHHLRLTQLRGKPLALDRFSLVLQRLDLDSDTVDAARVGDSTRANASDSTRANASDSARANASDSARANASDSARADAGSCKQMQHAVMRRTGVCDREDTANLDEYVPWAGALWKVRLVIEGVTPIGVAGSNARVHRSLYGAREYRDALNCARLTLLNELPWSFHHDFPRLLSHDYYP